MSIKRNSFYNFLGALAPIALSLVVTPLYLSEIGPARFGLLSLVWLTLGYFGLFDLGLANAATNALARSRSKADGQRSVIVITAVVVNLGLGLIIGTTLVLAAPSLIYYMKAPPDLKSELLAAVPWLAACIPLVSVGAVFTGVLSSHERFGMLNIIGVVGTSLFLMAPLIAAYQMGPSLIVIVPAAVLARALPVIATAILAARQVPWTGARFSMATLAGLLSYGAWVMVSNVVGPLLASIDQFAIAAVLGVTAVAHYSVGYGLAAKILIVPGAVMQTIFPRMSSSSLDEAERLANLAGSLVTILICTIAVPAILLVRPFMNWWLGTGFGIVAGPVAAVLILAVAINGSAIVPITYIYARRRPGVAARFHLAEVIPFLLALWLGMKWLGLTGAAFAWLFRVTLDAALLYRASGLRPRYSATALAVTAALTGLSFISIRWSWAVGLPLGLFLAALSTRELSQHLPVMQRLLERAGFRAALPS